MAMGKRLPDTLANPHKNAIANSCFSPAESRCLGTGFPFKSYNDKPKVLLSMAMRCTRSDLCNKYRKQFLFLLLIYSIFLELIFLEILLMFVALLPQN